MANKNEKIELDIEVKQNIIISQTSYTIEEAKELLENNNGDYIKVVLDYLKKDKPNVETKPTKQSSLNQTIFKHIRNKMNENMDEVISRMNGTIDM
jgi:hypothetical protein